MTPVKIDVRGDPRIQTKSAELNGRTYGELIAALPLVDKELIFYAQLFDKKLAF
jgi:hypothetical protein